MEAEVRLQSGALVIMGMFILTITMAVSSHHFLHMPPVLGMMAGLGLLVTLTAGVGGSMLSVGSAAGVAVMGQARGIYTFFAHLKWSWAIMLGYAASIWVHFYLNAAIFG